MQVAGVPDKVISLGELAQMANPMRGSVKPGTEPGLESSNYFGPEYGATANGVHAMIVELDPDTMMLEIKKYVCLLYTSPSPRDKRQSRMPSSA